MLENKPEAKVPVPSRNNVIDTPMKRRVLRSGTAIISDNESESSQKYGNREVSDDESHLEMMRLEETIG